MVVQKRLKDQPTNGLQRFAVHLPPLEGGQVALLHLRVRHLSHATFAAYSSRGTGASLKCSIFATYFANFREFLFHALR
jgi:hypothetical protein